MTSFCGKHGINHTWLYCFKGCGAQQWFYRVQQGCPAFCGKQGINHTWLYCFKGCGAQKWFFRVQQGSMPCAP